MFTACKTILRLPQASLIAAAIAVAGFSSGAQAASEQAKKLPRPPSHVLKRSSTYKSHGTRRLPSTLKRGMQKLSGADLAKVKVHRGAGSVHGLKAGAYARGTSIHLAPRASRHLPHEAWHAVQQKHGRVTPQASRLNALKRVSTASRASDAARATRAAKAAKAANTARKAAKLAKFGRLAVAGTGVGAVAAIGAGLAGVDPTEMALLKATNPAEYRRRMNALKKNPLKYMGNNVKNNTKKGVKTVAKAGKKAGCGIGNAFKKKRNRRRC